MAFFSIQVNGRHKSMIAVLFCIGFLLGPSCKKKTDSPTPPPSTELDVIWEFNFSESENGLSVAPFLSENVLLTSFKASGSSDNEVLYALDAESGELQSWVVEGETITHEPIRPNFWRPPTDNDYGARLPEKLQIWKNPMSEFQLDDKLLNFNSEDQVGIKKIGTILNGKVKLSFTYFIHSGGNISIRLNLKPQVQDLPMLPRLGFQFEMNIKKTFLNTLY